MSLIADTEELARICEAMKDKARIQQTIYFNLIQGMVRMHQEHRTAKNYPISDQIRSLLNDVGIEIIQGKTSGGRGDDTWVIKD